MKERVYQKKPYYDMAINKSITLPRKWFEFGAGRQRMLGHTTFSDYIQDLIRRDVMATDASISLPGVPKELQKERAARQKAASARR
jgi:hypothetical protein